MSGTQRYFVAAGLLALLAVLFVLRPSQEALFVVHTDEALGVWADLLQDERDDGAVTDTVALRLGITDGQGRELRPELEARLVERFERFVRKTDFLVESPTGEILSLACGLEDDTVSVGMQKGGVSAELALSNFWSLTPPFLTVLLAILLARTITALLVGVLFGAMLATGGVVDGLEHFAADYVWTSVLTKGFQTQVLAFVLLLSMSVGIMTKAGGIDGMVDLVRRFARSARSSQVVAWLMGLLVFFDDYANTIVVGSTMRPLTDRLRVSREKLAYVVDSTAAPVSGLAILSTWVAYEISQFAPSLTLVTNPDGIPYEEKQGFAVFLQTLPFRFYCVFTLFMVVATVVLKREFGPMLEAERRARREGKVLRDGATPLVGRSLTETRVKGGAPARWWNGVLPILTLILVTVWQIWETGRREVSAELVGFDALVGILEKADSTWAIFIGAASSAGLAALLAVAQRILGPLEALSTAFKALWALFFAVAILVLAWCMGFVCKDDLKTAWYLVALTEGRIPPLLLPCLLFLLSCLVSFAIGSSWSTMAILLPNVVLLSHALGEQSELGGPTLMILTIGAVLEGSIFGDHCSPISDTTVLSSVATASDHLDHVRTQVPYAVLVMVTSLVCGYLPVALLSPALWPICLATGAGIIVTFLVLRGRDPEAADPPVRA